MLISTSGGNYYTNDAGETWIYGDGNVYLDFVLKPGNSNVVYANTNSKIYKSINGGSAFSEINLTILNADLINFQGGNIEMAVTAANPNLLTVQISGNIFNANNKPVEVNRLYTSTNNGTSFLLKTNPSPGVINNYFATMGISNTNANFLYSGNVSLVNSSDGGSSYGAIMDDPLIHSDHHDIRPNHLNNKMYFCNDGGVYEAPDQSNDIIMKSNGIAATQFYSIAGTNLNDNIFVGGTQDNGVLVRKANGAVYLIRGGDGFDAKFLNGSADLVVCNSYNTIFGYNISTNTQFFTFSHLSGEFNPNKR